MFDYIVKYNKLPKELQEELSTPLVMAAIEELEQQFHIDLASLIMRVMVKEIAFGDLKEYFMAECELSEPMAVELTAGLASKVFAKVADYLGLDVAGILAEADGAQSTDLGSDAMNVVAPVASMSSAPAGQVRGAEFFFSTEDEEEIRGLTQKAEIPANDAAVTEANKKASLEERVAVITSKAEINFGSEELTNRFKAIITTYLREIRTRLDTKLTLTKAFDAGGLGFDTDSAEKVLSLADQSEQLLKEAPLPTPVELKPQSAPVKPQNPELAKLMQAGMRDMEYDLATEIKKKEEARKVAAAAQPVVEVPKTIADLRSAPLPPVIEAKITSPEPEADLVLVRRQQPDPIGKVKMEDIKYMPKTMGPVDELRYMDVASFRRLEQDPEKIIAKIKSKVQLLENESYAKRLEGIKAWRACPVSKLYLEIGEQAISNNQPIDIIIESRKTAGQDYLSSEEFEAIMALNKELRY